MTNSDNLPHRIASGLSRIGMSLRGLAWKWAAAEAVTPTQVDILQHLAEARGPLRLGEVAKALIISAPTASDAVSALEGKGFAVKVPGQDKRALAIELTPAGRDLAARAVDWPVMLAKAAETLSTAEQSAMMRALSKIIRKLQSDGAISVQRLCLTCQHFRPFANGNNAKPHHCALIDLDYGDAGLQLNCQDHVLAEEQLQVENLGRFDHST